MTPDASLSPGGEQLPSFNESVFELATTVPTWIWVHTCPTPECPCRSALILATSEGRDVLFERGTVVHEEWIAGDDYRGVAGKIEGITAFDIDIDSGEAFLLQSDTSLDVAEHPAIGAIMAHVDGALLDAIGSLWYRAKGLADPVQAALHATSHRIRGWQRGDMLAWGDACTGLRQDIYVQDGVSYEAEELYCPFPDCDCGDVVVNFDGGEKGGGYIGHVLLNLSSAIVTFEAPKEPKDRRTDLERLWAAFKTRHPKCFKRFAARYPIMKTIGSRLVPLPVAKVSKPGRNDSCPCGSGKKYKKCCGAQSR